MLFSKSKMTKYTSLNKNNNKKIGIIFLENIFKEFITS
jgi:hypothetical protein